MDPIGSAVLTFIGYKTDKLIFYIERWKCLRIEQKLYKIYFMLIITIIQVCDFIDGITYPNLESTTVWASRAQEEPADLAEKPNTSHS